MPKPTEPNVRKAPPQKSQSKRNLALIIAGSALVLLLIIWGIVALVGNNDSSTKTPTGTSTSVSNDTPLKHGATGKSVAQDQKDSLAALIKLVNAAGVSPTNTTSSERINSLQNGDFKVVSKELTDNVHFAPTAPVGFKKTTYQSLITINNLIQQQTGKTVIAESSKDAYQNIYVDSQLGVAYIPLSAISTNNAIFTVEMGFIDGRWQLLPYSLVSQVNISAILAQEGSSTSTATK